MLRSSWHRRRYRAQMVLRSDFQRMSAAESRTETVPPPRIAAIRILGRRIFQMILYSVSSPLSQKNNFQDVFHGNMHISGIDIQHRDRTKRNQQHEKHGCVATPAQKIFMVKIHTGRFCCFLHFHSSFLSHTSVVFLRRNRAGSLLPCSAPPINGCPSSFCIALSPNHLPLSGRSSVTDLHRSASDGNPGSAVRQYPSPDTYICPRTKHFLPLLL